MASENHIQVLDCSIRDGGYCNNWHFNKELVREAYRSLSKSGVTYVELGFRGNEKYFDPQKYGIWRFSSEEDLAEVTQNIEGAKIALMGDYGKIDLDDVLPSKDSCVDLIRLAAHKNKIFDAIDFLEKVKAKGYDVSLQCMGYSSFFDQEKADLLDALKKTEVDYVYVADSYGSIYPFQMREIFEPFMGLGNVKVGFHPHNNIQMAFANTLEALKIGVTIFDTTIYGMGRGAGNLPTEIFLSYLIAQGNEKYNVIPLLNCIEKFFIKLKRETPWGYQLPYMISGIFNSHPNYAKCLLEKQDYSIADIWRSLEAIQELKPIGYDKIIIDQLNEKGFFGVQKEGLQPENKYIDLRKDVRDCAPGYSLRHKDRDFLILANGPTLKKYKREIDSFIDTYKPIIMGANYLDDLYVPHYHAFNNIKRFQSYVDTVDVQSKLLVGSNIPKEIVGRYSKREFETFFFIDRLDEFDVINNVVTSNCRTISVLLSGIALIMGAKRIFVVGMDGYLNKQLAVSPLFYEEDFDKEEHEQSLSRHCWNERILGQINDSLIAKGGEGLHILTPTGHIAFYKSIENYI